MDDEQGDGDDYDDEAMVRGDKNDRECAQKLKIERLGLLGLSSVMHRLLFTTQHQSTLTLSPKSWMCWNRKINEP